MLIQQQADNANYYKKVDPYSDLSRGFDVGYKARIKEEDKKRISDEELLKRFDEAVRQDNMIVGDAALCVELAKKYANNQLK